MKRTTIKGPFDGEPVEYLFELPPADYTRQVFVRTGALAPAAGMQVPVPDAAGAVVWVQIIGLVPHDHPRAKAARAERAAKAKREKAEAAKARAGKARRSGLRIAGKS